MRRSSHNALFVFGLLSALALAACGGAGSTPDPEAPEAPEAPVIAGATPGLHQVGLSWNAVSGAEAYHVYYARGASVSASSGTRISATGTTTDVGGLASGKTYAFIVTAVNANGESAASEIMTASPEAAWGPKGGAGLSAGEAIYTSLAIGTGKAPYVAYGDKANSGKATVMKFNGEAWETVGGAGFSDVGVYCVSLAMSSGGVPYVAFRDSGAGGKATVMRFSGSAWEIVGSANFSAGVTNYVSLAMASGDTPYVAYQDDYANGYKATVMILNAAGTGWEHVGSVGFSAGAASCLSLAIDAGDRPYLAFEIYDDTVGGSMRVMKFNGAAWELVGNAAFSAGRAMYVSLALNSGDVPYVSYRDEGNDGRATVMRLNGATWESVGSAGFSAGGVFFTSLAMDSADLPYLAITDGANGEKASVMRWNGSAWETVGSAGFAEGASYYVSLALDPDDTPYVAYEEYGTSKKATVMYF